MRVLIVDDEIDICKYLKRELQKVGCEVEYTTLTVNVIERLCSAEKEGKAYELLFLDLRMPKTDGFKLLKQIREANLDLDVIIITGYGDEDKAIKAIRLGAVDYLRKPISLEKLRSAIFRIKQKRAAKENKKLEHNILIVDDEKDLCKHIKRELEREGYKTAVAYDGNEGLNYFKNSRVDMVITDIRMPKMSGLEMLERCRAITDDFVSIIITGHGDHETAIKALKLGVFNYLRKPISLEELVISVNKGINLLLLKRGLSAHRRELEIETAIREQYAKNLEKMADEKTSEIKKLYDIVQAATESIVTSDLNGKIIDLNEATLKMYGSESRQDLIGKSFFDIVAPEDREKAVKTMKEVMKKGYVRDQEYNIVVKDGSRLPVEMSVSIIEGDDGKPVGFVCVIKDITKRKQAEEKLKQSFNKLRRTIGETIQAIASIVEKRDPYTARHQRHVAQLAFAIAKEMNLSKEKTDGIYMAALIHDIGKINVPAEILSKPTLLNENEFDMIKNHPQIAYDILKTIEFPWPVAKIILQHHERMDGSGYPQGLKEKDILLEARILAVSDVVEAMSSHRPYRPAHGIDKALEEILQKKGVLYDPKVVDACVKLFTKKKFKFEQE